MKKFVWQIASAPLFALPLIAAIACAPTSQDQKDINSLKSAFEDIKTSTLGEVDFAAVEISSGTPFNATTIGIESPAADLTESPAADLIESPPDFNGIDVTVKKDATRKIVSYTLTKGSASETFDVTFTTFDTTDFDTHIVETLEAFVGFRFYSTLSEVDFLAEVISPGTKFDASRIGVADVPSISGVDIVFEKAAASNTVSYTFTKNEITSDLDISFITYDYPPNSDEDDTNFLGETFAFVLRSTKSETDFTSMSIPADTPFDPKLLGIEAPDSLLGTTITLSKNADSKTVTYKITEGVFVVEATIDFRFFAS